MSKIFLLRYDTERNDQKEMAGFFDKVVRVHRSEGIPASFFCTGKAIEARETDFRNFFAEAGNDLLFDIQDHSYSHVGLGCTAGQSVGDLKIDYAKSFAAHERVFGRRPIGISICGNGRVDGERLKGFDQTEKGRAEFGMIAELGARMINTFLVKADECADFCSYAALGHPEIMGFPSGYSDYEWLYQKKYGDPLEYVRSQIARRANQGASMPLVMHDWAAWNNAPDKELTHVKKIADYARRQGYTLATHLTCYQTRALWQQVAEV